MQLAFPRFSIYSGIILLMVLFKTTPSFSQSISEAALTWRVNSLIDEQSAQNVSYSCQFKTNGLGDVLWLQKNGSFTSSFRVTGSSGSWLDVGVAGQIIYQIQSEAESGTLEFAKDASGTHIRLNLSQSSAQPLRYDFKVVEVNLTNP